ncbi:unnamed protein product [Penicillium salamii]|nr:unnamed protein product [Penicillium salamii]CAG8372109.1 unnamed protein product [Penicillium salamii]
MEIFEDGISDLPPGPSMDGSDPQAEEIESLTQGATPLLEFPTPDLGGLSNFDTWYDKNGELKRNGLFTMGRNSQSPQTGDLDQPVETRQVFDIVSPSTRGEIQTETLQGRVLLPQNVDGRVLTAGRDVVLTLDEEFCQSDGVSGWAPSQQSSGRRSPGKRKYAGGTDLQKRKTGCFGREFSSSLCQEAEMARALGLSLPQDTYFRPKIETKLLDMRSELFSTLCFFLVRIGSAPSFVALRGALKSTRGLRDDLHHAQSRGWVSRDLTAKEQFQVIGEIQESATFLQILRCNHILNLYRHGGGTAEHTSDFAIMATSQKELVGQPRARGNPRKIEVGKVVDTMTRDIFPELDPSSAIYKRKRRVVLELRKFGQRLHMLTQRFGEAVLGLIHFDRSGDVGGPVSSEKM